MPFKGAFQKKGAVLLPSHAPCKKKKDWFFFQFLVFIYIFICLFYYSYVYTMLGSFHPLPHPLPYHPLYPSPPSHPLNTLYTSEAPSPGLKAEGRTPKLLRLKLHCI
jgi:hypothetical protein